jgi:LytS/YehU family sensor histidine kinase
MGLMLRWTIVSTAVLCYFLLLHRKRHAQAQVQRLALEASARDAEIGRLRAQINPHFLFNTLTAISNRSTDPRVDNIILKLSDFLRYNLSHTGGESRAEDSRISKDFSDLETLSLTATTSSMMPPQGLCR